MNGDLARATAQGVVWTGVSQVFRQGLQFVVVAVLARLLFPADFGVIAMAVFFTGLVGRITLGLRFPIIQRKELNQTQLSTLFWTGIALGALMWAIVVASSPLIATFWGNERVQPILTVLSAGFLIDSLGLVHGGLLNRDLEFKKLALVEILGAVAAGALSIGLAYAGHGVWSLVWGDLLGTLVTVVLLWALCPWRARMEFGIKSLREILGFGTAVVGNSIVNYFGTDADRLLVGKLLGSVSLGLYSQASRLTQFPRLNLAQIITRVTFPAFSRIQDDDARLRLGYLKSVAYISMMSFPLLVGLAVTAPEFVRVVYGERWVDMIRILQILCMAGLAASIGTSVGSVAFSRGRADLLLVLNLLKLPFLVVTILVGARYGMEGVAIAISVFFTSWVLFTQVFINRLIALSMYNWLRSLMPACFGTTVMVAILVPVRWASIAYLHLPNPVLLFSMVSFGAAVYFLTLRLAKTEELRDILQFTGDILTPITRGLPHNVKRRAKCPSTIEGSHSRKSDAG